MPRIIVPVVLLAASFGTAIADKPVTDGAGYPVVGNAMTKGGPPRASTQPVMVAPAPGSAPAYDDAGYPVVGNAMSKSSPPRLTAEQQRAHVRLRSTSPTLVRTNLTPYLPLCDAAGYPLVGNASGSSKAARMQPSELCTLVRGERAQAAVRTATAISAKPVASPTSAIATTKPTATATAKARL